MKTKVPRSRWIITTRGSGQP